MLCLKGSQAGFVRTLARQKKVTLTLKIIVIISPLGWVISSLGNMATGQCFSQRSTLDQQPPTGGRWTTGDQ